MNGSSLAILGRPRPAYVRETILLMHCEGANGGTATFDSSIVPKAITFTGDTSTSTAQRRFGEASLRFTGSNNSVRIGSQDTFNFSTDNWTIEMWAYPTAGGSGLRTLYSKSVTGTGPILIAHNGTNYVFYSSSNGSSWDIASAAVIGARTLNQWDHIAVVRNGSSITGYLNGVAGATATSSATLFSNSGTPRIGSNYAGADLEPWVGHVDEVRIVRGVPVYVNNFTPLNRPIPNP